MPVTYRIEKATRFIHTRCVGAVDLEEIRQHFTVLSQDPERADRLDVLLDLSEMTTLPATAQLRAVTDELERVRPQIQFGRCAIIASGEALFGLARMFEVFAERYFTATRVFRTELEGKGWLDHPRGSAT
jgi:hypothetical protein